MTLQQFQRDIAVNVRAADTGTRQFTGIGVPYNTPTEIYPGYTEVFAPGSVNLADNSIIMYRHKEPVGRIISGRDTAAGYEVTGELSDTATANDVHALMRDGVITRLSIGFYPDTFDTVITETGETTTHTKVVAREFSLVPFPAYDNAKITANVRNKNEDTPIMNTSLTRADLDLVFDKVESIERNIALIGSAAPAAPAAPEYRSFGAFVTALARDDEAAHGLYRSFAGRDSLTRATNGDVLADEPTRPQFVADYIRIVDAKRPVTNMFTRKTLSPKGNTVDFVRLDSHTLKVAQQVNETDDLVGAGKVTLVDDSAPVLTYGGYTEMSFQKIKRSTSVGAIDTALRIMAIEYARATESANAKLLNDIILAQTANSQVGVAASRTAKDWTNLIIDLVSLYNDSPYVFEGLILSSDLFKELSNVETPGNRLVNATAGVADIGKVSIKDLSGNVLNVPYRLVSTAPEGTLAAYDSGALEFHESPGAPAQLQDTNIINLTQQFSLYGEAASFAPLPGGIHVVTIGA